MKEAMDRLDEITSQLDLLAEAKGVMRCAIIVKIYQIVQSITEELAKADERNYQKKLIFEAKIKDLEDEIQRMKPEGRE